jgi:hypothetical protein
MRMRVIAAMSLLLASCAGPFPWQVPVGCNSTANYAFNGESSFTALGISTGSSLDQTVGHVWVTSGPVEQTWVTGGVDSPASAEPARVACALYPNGVEAIVAVPDDWSAPR